MRDFVLLMMQNPKDAITVIALFVCAILIWFFKDRLASDFARMERRLDSSEAKISASLNQTQEELKRFSAHLNASVSAIHEDTDSVRSSMLSTREDVINRISQIRDMAAQLERECKLIALTVESTTSKFVEKFGDLKTISTHVDQTFGRVILIEKDVRALKDGHIDHHNVFEKVKKVVTAQNAEIAKLKGLKRPNDL